MGVIYLLFKSRLDSNNLNLWKLVVRLSEVPSTGFVGAPVTIESNVVGIVHGRCSAGPRVLISVFWYLNLDYV